MLTPSQQTAITAMIADDFPGLGDYLSDHATVEDLGFVLVSFAGQPREYQGGLSQEVLWRWLKEVQFAATAGILEPSKLEVTSSRGPWSEFADGLIRERILPRWEAVRDMKANPQLIPGIVRSHPAYQAARDRFAMDVVVDGVGRLPQDFPGKAELQVQVAAVLCRDLKRSILALFPEVRFARAVDINQDDVQDFAPEFWEFLRGLDRQAGSMTWHQIALQQTGTLASFHGWNEHAIGFAAKHPAQVMADQYARLVRFMQSIPAPDLIPPEPQYGPSPLVDHYRQYRQEQEAMRLRMELAAQQLAAQQLAARATLDLGQPPEFTPVVRIDPPA